MTDLEHQNQQNLKITICDFLTQSPTSGALLLTGNWGTGKSTFYRTILANELKNRGRTPIYMSVAGASTVDQIEDRLFAAVHPFSGSTAGETLSVIWKTSLKILKVDPKDIKLSPGLSASMVVCIDDIERFCGETQTLFGFIQNLLEEEHIPCLLIGAEAKIGSRDAGDRGQHTYGIIREKIVAKSLEFQPSIVLALETLLENLDEELREPLRSRKAVILDVVAQDSTQNIRSLSAAIRDCGPILKAALDARVAENRISQLLGMTLAAIFEARRNNDHAIKVYSHLANPLDWLTQVGVERDDNNPVGMFLRRYANLKVQSWPAVPIIADYLATGIFDSAAISRELESIKEQSGQTPFRRLTGGDILELSDTQFSDDQDSYYIQLQESDKASLTDLVRGAVSLSYLADLGITKLSVAETLAAHSSAVNRHSASGTLDVEDYPNRLPDEDALHHIGSLGVDGQTLVRAISEAIPIAKARRAAEARDRVLNLLLTNFDQFVATVFDPSAAWQHTPLFVGGDPHVLGPAIAALQPAQLGRLREFFRWRGSVRAPGMAQEQQLLVEVASILREHEKREESPLRRFGLLTLTRMIEHAVDTAPP